MTRRLRPDLPGLERHLEVLRQEWIGRRLDSDPLLFPHRYAAPEDREVTAFLSASLAFGRVASIQASLEKLLACLGSTPRDFLTKWDETSIAGLVGFRHRWIGPEDLRLFLVALSRALRQDGSLKALFERGDHGEDDMVPALDRFYQALREGSGVPASRVSRGLRFLLPSPSAGGACKRAHLFLRWMVREGDVDLGLWTGGFFDPKRLLLPMDTHVHRISTYLALTRRKTADLAASREATRTLRLISPADPIRYDWALSRLGILAECVRERTRRHCERCAVRPVCRVTLVPSQPENPPGVGAESP